MDNLDLDGLLAEVRRVLRGDLTFRFMDLAQPMRCASQYCTYATLRAVVVANGRRALLLPVCDRCTADGAVHAKLAQLHSELEYANGPHHPLALPPTPTVTFIARVDEAASAIRAVGALLSALAQRVASASRTAATSSGDATRAQNAVALACASAPGGASVVAHSPFQHARMDPARDC